MPSSDEASLADLASVVLDASPQLQSRVADFVDAVLSKAEDVLENGTPKMQSDIINKLVPHLVRQLADKAEDEDIRLMRDEVNRLKSDRIASIGGVLPDLTPDPELEGLSEVELARVQKVMSAAGFDSIPTDDGPAKVIRIGKPSA